MKRTVKDLAKQAGFEAFAYDEIFELHSSEMEIIEKLSNIGVCTNIDELRNNLELAGKRCTLYAGLMELLTDGIDKAKHDIESNVGDTYAIKKWLTVIQTHYNVYELMGFLTLLQMDAMTTIICLLQAINDTERIMLSKHAYTIMYEAKQNDLFKKVSAEMHKYPDDLVARAELNVFWKDIKAILNKMMDTKEAKGIRNNLDAHKNQSFTTQISFYKKCDWSRSVVGLSMFVILIEKIQIFMEIIHHKIDILYNQYRAFMEDRIKQYEEILRQLREYKEPTK